MMKTAEIRKAFLDYFQGQGHTMVPSSALVPHNDATLLFTNAGMVQFKNVFLGQERRSYVRAASAQRCLRAGGKHNDLDNVGYTARHHTFFEMLGNFSFGDYFKKEAIRFAWDFLTQVLKLPPDRLWVTVFEDDQEAEQFWFEEIGIDRTRFSRCGAKDNFWAMGDVGPCGPCTEIFYDHGPSIAGGPPGSPEADGDRYIEIWNLVFMQFDRQPDGTLLPLPKPCVDTGMGLERISAVMQGVHSNYEIDLFTHLRQAIASLAKIPCDLQPSLCVVADHLRAISFLMVDGVIPSNEGRGYVLRRIIRRAVRHGYKLGFKGPFLHQLIPALVQVMGEAYPELRQADGKIQPILLQEEQQFALTLENGLRLFEKALQELKGQTIIPGEVVFKLYDTHGFPMDLTADLARERKLQIDEAGFERALAEQRAQSQAASTFKLTASERPQLDHTTEFLGYEHLTFETHVQGLFQGATPKTQLECGEQGIVVLERTPFYAESGGQVGDRGLILGDGTEFMVQDTQKYNQTIVHLGIVQKGTLRVNQPVHAQVNMELRQATALNHSATHLLHAALRTLLGTGVQQKGSLVEPERLRFDFSHSKPLTEQELETLERMVNDEIRADHSVVTCLTTPDEAIAQGAVALFGERYGDQVRFLTMGDFSKELCGGTHVKRTGEIGIFKIIQETGVAAGVRRIEAMTGAQAFKVWQEQEREKKQWAALLKTSVAGLPEKMNQLLQRQNHLEQQLQRLQQQLVKAGVGVSTQKIGSIELYVHMLEDMDIKGLREVLEHYKSTQKPWVAVAASVVENKVQFVVGVNTQQIQSIKAVDLAQHLAQQLGGKSGGRADFAQGGGPEAHQLKPAIESIVKFLS